MNDFQTAQKTIANELADKSKMSDTLQNINDGVAASQSNVVALTHERDAAERS
ncbi:hypothetical protein Nit79A3_2044 [Nitrosomonas sp. Is79A3]|uniref:hypothetical protein n=1 Tax=Nitrosomonas sp. (strain Is79A3) TaxID=261292 RepID=UPI000215D01C